MSDFVLDGLGPPPPPIPSRGKTVRYATWFRVEIAKIADANPTLEGEALRKVLRGQCPVKKPYPRRVWSREVKRILGMLNRTDDRAYPLVESIDEPGGYGICLPSKST